MKDYASMSDFEINSEVLFSTSPGVTRVHLGDNGKWYFYVPANSAFAAKVAIPDYCNNPADAWPVIIDSMISIRPVGNDGQLWEASGMDGMKADYDKNPLRSAMIVFLMMKESE